MTRHLGRKRRSHAHEERDAHALTRSSPSERGPQLLPELREPWRLRTQGGAVWRYINSVASHLRNFVPSTPADGGFVMKGKHRHDTTARNDNKPSDTRNWLNHWLHRATLKPDKCYGSTARSDELNMTPAQGP